MRNTFLHETLDQLVASRNKGSVELELLAKLGHLAPSVHNTQPWKITIHKSHNLMHIAINEARQLPHTDPILRQTWISLGAFLYNILAVCETLGIQVAATRNRHGQTLAFTLNNTNIIRMDELRITIQAIIGRHNNRRNFTSIEVSRSLISRLSQSKKANLDVSIYFVKDRRLLIRLAELSYKASLLAFSSRRVRHELATHINLPFSRRQTGIPASTINSSFMHSLIEKPLARSAKFIEHTARAELQRMRHTPLLALIFSSGDTEDDWLKAGMQYENLCLRATELGLSHSTNAALVEAPDYYKDVSKLLCKTGRLQAVIRIGYAKSSRTRSRRLSLNEVLHISNNTC